MQIARLNSAPEIFYSLQGEGVSVGMPALFLRLAGCNLSCAWCDTKYSWGNGMECSPAELRDLILTFDAPRLIVTGGEPLLQMVELEELLRLLPCNLAMEFETNGTILPSAYLRQRVNQWNVSPKLAHAKQLQAIDAATLQEWAKLPHVSFKFVIQQRADWEQIELLKLPRETIILMPCATSREELRERRADLAQLCIEKRVRLGDRLHLELWDRKKGV